MFKTIKIIIAGLTLFFASTTIADDSVSQTNQNLTNPSQRLEPEVIRLSDNLGTVEELRVQGIQSEIRYISSTGSTYNLTSVSASNASQSEHRNTNELMIPRWEVFVW